jgi:hypothetical protein
MASTKPKQLQQLQTKAPRRGWSVHNRKGAAVGTVWSVSRDGKVAWSDSQYPSLTVHSTLPWNRMPSGTYRPAKGRKQRAT